MDSVHEDIGYRGGVDMTENRRLRMRQEMKRIRYTQGIDEGAVRNIKAIIADDLIERGFAVEVDRDPGEEG